MDSGLDGSDHHWFEDRGPRCCLEHHGKPVAFYSDKAAERISTRGENLNLGRSVGADSSLETLALLRCDTCRPATSMSEVWNKSLPQMSASTEYSSG